MVKERAIRGTIRKVDAYQQHHITSRCYNLSMQYLRNCFHKK